MFKVILPNSFEERVHYVCSIPCKILHCSILFNKTKHVLKSAGITTLTIQDSSIAMVTGVHSVAQCAGSNETTSRFVTGRRRRWKPAAEFSRQTWLGTEEVTHNQMLLKTEKFVIRTVFFNVVKCSSAIYVLKDCFKSYHVKYLLSWKFLVEIGRENVYFFSFRYVMVQYCRPPNRSYKQVVFHSPVLALIFLFMFCGVPFSSPLHTPTTGDCTPFGASKPWVKNHILD